MLENYTIPRQKIKNFWGGDTGPSVVPCPIGGGGHPLPKPYPLGVCSASTLAPSALDMYPPFENPGSASGL